MGRTPGAKNKPKGPAVTTQTKDRTEALDQATSKGEVAIFQPARLPYHPAVEERFGVDKGQWKVLVEAIFPAAKSVDAIVMALTYCKSRNLDPFKRPVHIVPMYDSARGGYVETVWPGISELRTTASRTKGYAGCDEAEFGPEKTFNFEGRVKRNGNWETGKSSVTVAEWCRITVYRIIDGQRCKFVGPKVKWIETYANQGASELPNKMWEKRSEGQLEKCAEAAALRRAFPEEMGNELTAEEMVGKSVHDLAVDIQTATSEAPTLAADRDAGPPRQIAAPAEQDQEQARDGTPPPRPPKATPKEDPISSGPPRATAKKPDDKAPEPYRIPGDGHTFESYAEKVCDLIQTSPDIATVYKWIDINSKQFTPPGGTEPVDGGITRLTKRKPSVAELITKTAKQTMEKLRAEQAKAEEKAAKKAAAAAPPSSDMDEAGHGDMMGDAEAPDDDRSDFPENGADDDGGPADTNPETILKWAKAKLEAVADPDGLEPAWAAIEQHTDSLFPPDQDVLAGYYRAAEKRLGGG